MSRMKFFVILLAVVFVIGTVGNVYADSGFFNDWKAAYSTSATSSFSCSICHTSAPTLNGYGNDVLAANFNFKSVESQDSDGDKASNIAEMTAGTNPGSASSTPAPTPVACTGYTYSAWSVCGTNGQQTRTVTANTPSGCTGTPSTSPVLTQTCTPAPVACTGYTYSGWSACGTNGQQTRTIAGNAPSGCTGTPSVSPLLTQSCTPSQLACTSYTYSEWSACQSNNRQTRAVVSSSPAGCTGTPLLTQICNYVPPTPTPPPPTPPPVIQIMEVPAGQQVFSYKLGGLPVLSGDPAQAKPIGVGPAASGGNMFDVSVNIGPFTGPVDVSMVVYAPAVNSGDLYFMSSANELIKLSSALSSEEDDSDGSYSEEDNSDSDAIFNKFFIWQSNVTEVTGTVFTGSVGDLPSGLYTLVLVVTSPDNDENYYRWITHVIIP